MKIYFYANPKGSHSLFCANPREKNELFFSSIKARLALIFCSIYSISFLLIFQFTSDRFKETLEKNILEQNLQKIIEWSGKLSEALKWGNWATIEVAIKSRFKQNPDWLFILVRDKDGGIVVSTDDALYRGGDASYLPDFNMGSSKERTLSIDPWEDIQQSIHYQWTTLKGNIIHTSDIVASKGEKIFDAYVRIIHDNEILGSVRTGFSRRTLIKDIRQLQLFLITTEFIALLISVLLVIAVIGKMLKAMTELSGELSKISYADNPRELLAQLQSISVDKIKVKTYELRELRNASQRFQQQLVLNVEQAAKYSHLEMHARRMEDIAKTTQMLAHDVRKPFSMILMVMQTLKDCNNPCEILEIINKFLPEVQAAITAANDMIDDVMEIDRAQQPKKKPVDPLLVLKESLKEISRVYPSAQVDIHYKLNHQHMIDADALKLQRVLSNIISNAVQAMNNTGVLRVSTLENVQTQMTTFCIENNGVYLPKDEMLKVFDAFYTKNKSNGTGLGLAISQRIIMAHGGAIWCESSQSDRIVKFYFTVPFAAKNPIRPSSIRLPSHLQDLTDGLFPTSEVESAPKNIAITGPRLLSSERKIHQYSARNGRKLKLCILDDELIYQSGLVQLIQKSQPLVNSLDIRLAKTREEVMVLFATDTPDLLICDVDLGIDGPDGLQIVRELRKNGYKQAVCIHSNSSLPEDYEALISAGAQAILPKPMSLEHLIKFILDSIPGIR